MDSLNEAERTEIAAGRVAALEQATKAFDDMDLNSDGEVTQREVLQAASPGASIPENLTGGDMEAVKKQFDEMFAQFDADGDGKIQKAEWVTKMGEVYDSVVLSLIASRPAQ